MKEMMPYVVLMVVQIILIIVNYIVYRATKKYGLDPEKHSVPLHTENGEGVVIMNKDNRPVVEFKKPLK